MNTTALWSLPPDTDNYIYVLAPQSKFNQITQYSKHPLNSNTQQATHGHQINQHTTKLHTAINLTNTHMEHY